MASGFSCVVITTLVIVSLANLLLLIHMYVMGHCHYTTAASGDQSNAHTPPVSTTNTNIRTRYTNNQIRPRDEQQSTTTFAENNHVHHYLLLLSTNTGAGNGGGREQTRGDRNMYCIGVAVDQYWTLTSAHCALTLLTAEQEVGDNNDYYGIRGSQGGGRKSGSSGTIFASDFTGRKYNVTNIVVHEHYDPKTLRNNVALVGLLDSFQGCIAVLPLYQYSYTLNTTGTSVGGSWYQHFDNMRGDSRGVFGFSSEEVRVDSSKNCLQLLRGLKGVNVDSSYLFCGRFKKSIEQQRNFSINKRGTVEMKYSGSDIEGGEVLFQGQVVVGVSVVGGAREDGYNVRFYTKVAVLRRWFESVDATIGMGKNSLP